MSERKTRIISICWTDIVEHAHKGHSAFTRSESNGKIYVSLKVQDKPTDEYKKDVTVLLNPTKENRGTRENPSPQDRVFVGNGITIQPATTTNSPDNPINLEVGDDDDLPF